MRRILVIAALLAACATGYSSSPRRVIPDKSCIHPDKSSLTIYGDSTGFRKVFAKMDTLINMNQGRVNIVHMGGSHVEAGVLTEQLRDNLMRMADTTSFQDGGLGMAFPFTSAKLNTPLGYTTKHWGTWTSFKNTKAVPDGETLGLMGVGSTAQDTTASVAIIARQRMGNGMPPYTMDTHVKVLGYGAKGVYPTLWSRDSLYIPLEVLDREEGVEKKDSIWTFDLAQPSDSVVVRQSKKGKFVLNGMYFTNDNPGFVVSPVGVNGASLPSYLRCTEFSRDLALATPDMVIFGIGINDASGTNFKEDVFIERYTTLCDKVRAINPDCAIIFITNNDSCRRVKKTYVNNPNGAVAQKCFHTLAKKYNAAVWDLFEVMGGLKSIFTWEKQSLAKKDKIHFTNEGYMILGDMLYNAIAEQYDAYKDGGKI